MSLALLNYLYGIYRDRNNLLHCMQYLSWFDNCILITLILITLFSRYSEILLHEYDFYSYLIRLVSIVITWFCFYYFWDLASNNIIFRPFILPNLYLMCVLLILRLVELLLYNKNKNADYISTFLMFGLPFILPAINAISTLVFIVTTHTIEIIKLLSN